MIRVVTNMDNVNVFKALSSSTRRRILKQLTKEDLHITALAKKIGISVPVMSRHVDILEKSGLVKKKVIGNVHLLSIDFSILEKLHTEFAEHNKLEVEQNKTLFDALQQLPSIRFETYNDKQFITSIDGEQGFYIYEVNGKPPVASIDEYTLEKDVMLSIKKIIPIEKKQINLRIKMEKTQNTK
jgi:DNA-binding transcriptional ArsR family regulator